MRELLNLLRSKEIIEILDGDAGCGEVLFDDGERIIIKMPYLSGQDLCVLSTKFGLPVTYNWGGTNLSRWQYLDNLMKHCIREGSLSNLLSYLFSKEQFVSLLKNNSPEMIEKKYQIIIGKVMERINGILYFGGNELTVVNGSFSVRKMGSTVEIEAPKIKTIDREYIKTISLGANEDIEQRKFDGALTKSRTILEETFCYVIEQKGVTPANNGNIAERYKQVKELYNMHADPNADKRINKLLSGLEKIISSITEMRNKDSDAHGVGSARITIEEHHARLVVNSAIAMADFILSVADKNKKKM